ncbi:PKD domain-containing protein [Chitinophaga sp. 30R24]|uniref:PKD domain-containing protein n=1 Tax=Chitinophaga sp. 30R24 TaxID=3248838 RepID=UPI003B9035A2
MPSHQPKNEHKVNSFKPFGKIASHVDPMIRWAFLGLFLISMVLLAFQMDSRIYCSDINIVLSHTQHINGNTYTVGEVITFNATATKKDAGYTWDFGDSGTKATGLQVYHSFNKAGSYLVTLRSGSCSWTQEVLIAMPPPANTTIQAAIFPVIDGPSEVFEGRPVTFSNTTPGANTWNWRLMQDNAAIHTKATVTYTFFSPGEKTLSLIINGDSSHMVLKHIMVFPPRPATPDNKPEQAFNPATVMPAPEQPAAAMEKHVPAISDDEFRYLLTQVILKQKTAADFVQYFCSNLNARVILNSNNIDNFTHFCSRIYGKKKFRIERVNLNKDEHGCVKEILIVYDRKKLLGIF